MSDVDQPGEELDENLTGEYPPDRPTAVFDEGVTGVEQLGGESVAGRDDRLEPEAWESGGSSTEAPVLTGDADVDAVDDEKDLVATPAAQQRETGSLAEDDEFTGDESTRDYGTERAPGAAEDAAVHIDDEVPGGTG